MGKRIVWHTPLSPAQVKEVLKENVDTVAGIPFLGFRGMPRSQPGHLPLMGVFNAYSFHVQVQPRMQDPFATFCHATVEPGENGSRVTARFRHHPIATCFFLAFVAWAFVVMGFLVDEPLATRVQHTAAMLAVAALVALFARWRLKRDTSVLEEFLTRTLRLRELAPGTRSTRLAAESVT